MCNCTCMHGDVLVHLPGEVELEVQLQLWVEVGVKVDVQVLVLARPGVRG